MKSEPQKNHSLFDRAEMKKQLFHTDSQAADDAFLKEAKEGWNVAGEAAFDGVMQRIDARIDAFQEKEKEEELVPINRVSKFRRWIPLSLAASLVLGFVLTWNLWNKDTSQELFAAYYRPMNAHESVMRGGEDNVQPSLLKAAEAFDNEDYEHAILYYRALLNAQPNNSKYTLFLGMSYLSSGKPKAAIQLYNNYTPNGDSFDEDIHWYLALAYLQTGEVVTARIILEEIAAKNNYYSPNAVVMLKKL